MRILLAMAMIALTAPLATAQQVNVAGRWYCTVNARSNQPDGNYGLEAEIQVSPNGTLQGRGNVFFPNLRNSVQPFQGPGDWTILPPEPGLSALVKFRVHTNTHGIVVWFARPTGPGQMYNRFTPPPQNGRQVDIETQCGKTG
ncbi:hypothetical protein [Pseudooceanicola sp.]|uniref:hypothetical protein n=1 Tax=Pseudooceanicola sp. TaxID=1914328 RepID=UPI00262AB917|nr:hypothetical protein [Pseudooceanicola sp.]